MLYEQQFILEGYVRIFSLSVTFAGILYKSAAQIRILSLYSPWIMSHWLTMNI